MCVLNMKFDRNSFQRGEIKPADIRLMVRKPVKPSYFVDNVNINDLKFDSAIFDGAMATLPMASHLVNLFL